MDAAPVQQEAAARVPRSPWFVALQVSPVHPGWYEVTHLLPDDLVGFMDTMTEPKPRARWDGTAWVESELVENLQVVSWRGMQGRVHVGGGLDLRASWAWLALAAAIEQARDKDVTIGQLEQEVRKEQQRRVDLATVFRNTEKQLRERIDLRDVQIKRLEKRHQELINVDKCWTASREINERLGKENEVLLRENERLKRELADEVKNSADARRVRDHWERPL